MQQQPEIVAFPLSETDGVNPPNCLGFEDALLMRHSVSALAPIPNFSGFVPYVEARQIQVK